MMYRYITENNLDNRQNYMYSSYEGEDFLAMYQKSREDYLKEQAAPLKEPCITVSSCLSETEKKLTEIDFSKEYVILQFVKSFEVRKRMYTAYNWETCRPLENSTFENMDVYLLFAEKLCQFYDEKKGLNYLNCLLKVNDTLLSIKAKLSQYQQTQLAKIIQKELFFIEQLRERK